MTLNISQEVLQRATEYKKLLDIMQKLDIKIVNSGIIKKVFPQYNQETINKDLMKLSPNDDGTQNKGKKVIILLQNINDILKNI